MTGRLEQNKTLIDELLAEQRTLTAVSRFAQKHERQELPLQGRFYRELLPLSRPGPGEQYRFEVDLDKCSGCKACVAACHSLNGLEEEESWRSVGLLVSAGAARPLQMTVTTACHHCAEPACADGCPVLAYEKDPATGIVKHLDDQCIGCQYCVMKCPYEVPRYSERLGIVRKCDMCSNRLAAGEAPACVQSCPSEAIRITIVSNAELRSEHDTATENSFLPASPNPSYTIPSTRYVSDRLGAAPFKAADADSFPPAPAHWPLVWMLVLTQAGAGGFLAAGLSQATIGTAPAALILASGVATLLGLIASAFHLGRPFQAWKAFLGLRKSWLSREIVVLGLFGQLAALLCAREIPGVPAAPWLTPALLAGAAVLGLAGVFASGMVYHDTRKELWTLARTLPRFFGTVLLLGGAIATALLRSELAVAIVVVTALFRLMDDLGLAMKTPNRSQALSRTARLLSGPLRPVFFFRIFTLFLGALLLPISPFALVLLFVSEIAERSLFFRSVAQPKMPGGVA